MTAVEIESTAIALVADAKGILAADETPGTLTRRFDALHIPSMPDTRRDYREMLFGAPGIARFISGVIMQDETIHQRSSTGVPFAEMLTQQGVIPGIKVDAGAKRLAGTQENITEGLDGLRDRLKNYAQMGARFAKWRAVIRIGDGIPTLGCVQANAHALARYAALCQEQGLVPIVEPEVLMDGSHTVDRCEEVTSDVLQATFDALFEQHVSLDGMLLKPNMVIAGKECPDQPSVRQVALATVRCLRRRAPAAVPGIVFLSGGQDHIAATVHLNAINQVADAKPWKLSFSYGRALQDEALGTWHGNPQNVDAARKAFTHRAECISAAALGKYMDAMERPGYQSQLQRGPQRADQSPLDRDRYQAVLFDMDGVVTDTASIHAACWKLMFDEYLEKWAKEHNQPFRPFDVGSDYKLYVDGKPRYQGVRDFLRSRGIVLPEGTREDPPTAETVCGLGNRKNELVNERLAASGIEAYPGSIAVLQYLRHFGMKTAIVTSSQNCQTVLRATKLEDLFDVRIDGDVIAEQGLAGKPAPDSFLKAAEMLGVPPKSAVVVEDAISGVQAGAKGGFGLVIGVARKGNEQELKANGAHVVVNDLADLLTWDATRILKPAA